MDETDPQSSVRRGSSDTHEQSEPPVRPDSVNPRRKYKRQITGTQERDEHSSDLEDGSESSLSTAEELEMNDMGSDAGSEADEETGLTSKESRKHLQKKRLRTPLDARIAGDTNITKEAAKLADKAVISSLLVNSVLIGLWYIFALAISIVCPMPQTTSLVRT